MKHKIKFLRLLIDNNKSFLKGMVLPLIESQIRCMYHTTTQCSDWIPGTLSVMSAHHQAAFLWNIVNFQTPTDSMFGRWIQTRPARQLFLFPWYWKNWPTLGDVPFDIKFRLLTNIVKWYWVPNNYITKYKKCSSNTSFKDVSELSRQFGAFLAKISLSQFIIKKRFYTTALSPWFDGELLKFNHGKKFKFVYS